ncbi:efflux RND transporter periplasmic adaptor subunit [Marinobacter sp. M216]|uniref:Efflux RND transporter periplasmic adaptor subunit n=1 Tax=Marinobacter albus TaxID=3030833 RepID=A0ABT7HD75_9GAMM|nr:MULTISPECIES: efflux RND transporter periplasmic adaptor subunit [unclassified Marinobacter]MBW7471742.1 efflux RND transporter periplasmic adaptor subunit [Marinobacter sp. F4218]MDK9558311.1 efflux RND transporter periplasmic adaptor subunit [Marinobacter sp. M216]
MWKQWLVALMLVVVAAGAAVGYQNLEGDTKAQAGRERPASVVNTRSPEQDTVRDVVKSVGNLRAVNAVALTPEVSGRVVALNLQPGARVSEGDLLLRLDDRQARADIQVIESQLADSRRQLERAQRLRSNNSISQAQVDELRTAVNVAEAQLAAARVRLENHRILAPFDGVVGLSDIAIGAYVTAGTPLTTLDSTDRMELNFSIPERFLGQLGLGQPVTGVSPAFPDVRFSGELAELGTRINELSRTLPVRALINNPDGMLRPGQFMSATLTLRERQALVIPEQAVMIRGDEQYVFVAEDGIARRISVTLGSRMPGRVEVADGLTLEDAVIVTGQDRISSGDRIEVVDGENAIPDNRFSQSLES